MQVLRRQGEDLGKRSELNANQPLPGQERSDGVAVGANGIQTSTRGLEYRDGARCHRCAALRGLGSKLRRPDARPLRLTRL